MIPVVIAFALLVLGGYVFLLRRYSPSNPTSEVWSAPETSFFEWKERNGIH